MSFGPQFFLTGGQCDRSARILRLLFQYFSEFAVINNIAIGLNRSQTDLVNLLLLLGYAHTDGSLGYLHIVHSREAVKERNSGSQ